MEGKRDLLIEVGIEELPHGFVMDAMKDFTNLITTGLEEQKVSLGVVSEYSTPRRMALLIEEVAEKQQDYREEKRGPSVEKAYLSNGKPSKALEGFLKGNKSVPEEVVIKEAGSARYVFIQREIKGKETILLLPGIVDGVFRSLVFPKSMRWEMTNFSFARPIRWLLFLYGAEIVPFEIAGISSSNYTFGHRSCRSSRVRIETPDKYEQKLLAASVVADRKKRKKSIHRQIDSLVQTKGLAVPEVAEGLYDVCTDLTEYPHAVLCSFEEYFLGLPPEVLISEMIEHQHYFPLISRTDKSLSNQFVVISNIEDNELSRYGYQRVLRARLADGAFFNSEDKKRNFADYLEKLKTVTFHEKLGSVYEKVQRIRTICTVLSDLLLLDAGKKAAILQTAALCKNDLVTLMINEFPNLQGIMGYYYAVASGFSEEVALGIKEHYFPRFAADLLPSGIEGAVVGMADRLDTIMGIFSIGIRPKGSRDPFALRRNVFALVKIIIDRKLNFSMRALLQKITSLYTGITTAPAVVDEIEDFIKSRIKSVFSELGFLYDEIEASLSNVMEDIYEAYRRVLALHDFRSNRDFEDLLTSFKRMANITRDEKSFSFSEDSLVEKDEKELYGFFNGLRDSIRKNIELKKYDEVYRLLSTFKPYVDSFFDNVLVMDEDLELRKNRMGLLKEIINVFSDIIDIAKIVSQ